MGEIMRKVIYIGIILVNIFLFFLFNEKILGGILVFLLIYGIAAFLYLYTGKKLKIQFMGMKEFVERNQPVSLCIHVENPGKRTRNYKIFIKVINQKAEEVKAFSGTIDGEAEKTWNLEFGSIHCGNINFEIEKIELYDFIGFLKKKIKGNKLGIQPLTVGILPKYAFYPVEITRRTKEYVQDGEDYTPTEKGDDPSEIYQIRPYEKSDPLHSIHWKMSAKLDELMIKEQSKPQGCVVLVWVNLSYSKKIMKNYLAGYDQLMDKIAGISFSLIAAGVVHMVAWYEKSTENIIKFKVKREEDVYELLHRLLYVESFYEDEKLAIRKQDAFRGIFFSSEIEVCVGTIFQKGTGFIKINGALIHEISCNKTEKEEDIYLTV